MNINLQMEVVTKLLFILLILFPQFLFSQKQNISVDIENEKIEDVLIDLAVEHGYEIIFNSSYFDEKTVTVKEQNQSIDFILQQILADTKVDISIKGKNIILTKRRKVYGYILDMDTGEALISATVYDPLSGIGTLTNEFGLFSLEIPFENKFLMASYVGYAVEKFEVDATQSFPINIKIKRNGKLSDIIVTKDQETIAVEQELGKKDLITNDIKTLFATGGEPDVFQFLYTQPGITTGPDGLGGVHVRGGDASHNLFLYDGVKVYMPFHSLGLFSIFDANQLKHANFSKYGFNPRHGGRLSSVLEMNVKEGDVNQWNSEISFSTLATHVGVNGPLKKNQTSLSLYARRTHLDPIFKNITKGKKEEYGEEGYSNHYFFDINAKLNHRVGKRDKFSLTMYSGKDDFEDRTDFYYEDDTLLIDDVIRNYVDWQNQLGAFKWNHLYNEKLFSNLTLSYTSHKYKSTYQQLLYDYELGFGENEENSLIRFFSKITDFGGDIDFDFFPNNNHHITFGLGYHHIIYRPGVGQDSLDSFSSNDIEDPYLEYFDDNLENGYASDEVHFYINDKWRIRKNLHLNIGGRVARFNSKNLIFISNSEFNVYQGNLSLRWALSKNFSSTLSLDHTEQPVHLLSTANIGFPNDLWLPSIENIKPAKANQINLGLDYRSSKGLSIAVDGYFKKMDNLVKFQEMSSLPSLFNFFSDFWESEVVIGNGISKGIETEIAYQTQQFKTSLAYTFSKTDRTFEGFNNDKTFPFEFDQRHKLTINHYQKLNQHFWLYANWNFYNGLRQTLYSSYGPFRPLDTFFPPPDISVSEVNENQLPDYHRLDVGIVWRKENPKVHHELNFGIQNIYNRENIFFSYLEEDYFDSEITMLQNSKALPLLPSLMYKVGF